MEHYSYFSNKECEYFPCHEGADKENFNCLFCYCPLYALDGDCGGNYRYTDKGIKDCSYCLVPHKPKGYDYVTTRFQKIIDRMRELEARKKGAL